MKFTKLRIHVWGGLGSQLFAIALAFQMRKKMPRREIQLVLHTGGVTKRLPEVYELFPEFLYTEVDDFAIQDSKSKRTPPKLIFSLFLKLIRSLALFLGVLAEENRGNSRVVKKWTIAVRGHYFHREIEEDFLRILEERLQKKVSEIESVNVVLHYRLGDLWDLETKSPVDSDRVAFAILNTGVKGECLIFSDSPERAIDLLIGRVPDADFKAGNSSTFSTLLTASNAETFIGTSSKISYWIALLRSRIYKKNQTFMPVEDRYVFHNLSRSSNRISFYS